MDTPLEARGRQGQWTGGHCQCDARGQVGHEVPQFLSNESNIAPYLVSPGPAGPGLILSGRARNLGILGTCVDSDDTVHHLQPR